MLLWPAMDKLILYHDNMIFFCWVGSGNMLALASVLSAINEIFFIKVDMRYNINAFDINHI